MPHHFGKAPVFLDNPATTGNAVDTQNIVAVAIASGRLQRGTDPVLGAAGSRLNGCGPVDIMQKAYHKALSLAIHRLAISTFSMEVTLWAEVLRQPLVKRGNRHLEVPCGKWTVSRLAGS